MHLELGLKDKVAIVTGGSEGIGKATARQLARELRDRTSINVDGGASGVV